MPIAHPNCCTLTHLTLIHPTVTHSQTQDNSTVDKRAHHNLLERRRRDHIKDSFHDLRDCIPSLQGEKVDPFPCLHPLPSPSFLPSSFSFPSSSSSSSSSAFPPSVLPLIGVFTRCYDSTCSYICGWCYRVPGVCSKLVMNQVACSKSISNFSACALMRECGVCAFGL